MLNSRDGHPLSPKYIEALYQHQKDFLASITASEEDARRYREADPDWVSVAHERALRERKRDKWL